MASSAVTTSSCRILVIWSVYGLLVFRNALGDGELFKSKATFYATSDGLGTPSGACGYGSFGRTLNGGQVAAASDLYKDGIGCGSCYQITCTNEELCTEEGVTIVVTDYGVGNGTEFIMSPTAYSKLAQPDKAKQLVSLGVIDIEYKGVSCKYPGYNLMIKIDESSKFPDYLAIQFWYQGGQKDILSIELSQEKNGEQKTEMKRNHGAVWDVVAPPKGALWVRFLAGGYRRTSFEWITAANAIPANWEAGAIYDSGIQIS
ncbi:expansin-like B1 [Cryptomeria japonica]|uniref:expansin-like B1 n=1 Tax=Cryptomeria japonica TaxID=3369 RepID=UPI0027D9DABB|nr:expansin-like B1 [Cryptomeria japonica]